jgi:hypothetical protein
MAHRVITIANGNIKSIAENDTRVHPRELAW